MRESSIPAPERIGPHSLTKSTQHTQSRILHNFISKLGLDHYPPGHNGACKTEEEDEPVKWLLPIFWMALLSVLCFNDDLGALLFHQEVHYHFVPHPKFSELWMIADVQLNSSFWLIVKTGHLLGFALLEKIFLSVTRKRGLSILLTLSLAVSSEVLQLFFARDGRILDMFIDFMGIMLSYRLSMYYLYKKQKNQGDKPIGFNP